MNRIVILCAAFIVSAILPVTADTTTVNGITWTYTVSNGEASLGGGSSSSPAVSKFTKGDLYIPSKLNNYPVTSIGNYGFYDCSELTSVTIPNSVTSIGSSAFSGCSCLTSVTIPDSVTSIGVSAFSGCSGLMSFSVGSGNANYKSDKGLLLSKGGKTLVAGVNGDVTIPDSVTSIGHSAFSHFSGLKSVTIPDSMTSIGSSAFYGCSGLTSVTIPDSVTNIGARTFEGCWMLSSVTIPQCVCTSSLSSVFSSSYLSITNVVVSDGVTSIPSLPLE